MLQIDRPDMRAELRALYRTVRKDEVKKARWLAIGALAAGVVLGAAFALLVAEPNCALDVFGVDVATTVKGALVSHPTDL